MNDVPFVLVVPVVPVVSERLCCINGAIVIGALGMVVAGALDGPPISLPFTCPFPFPFAAAAA